MLSLLWPKPAGSELTFMAAAATIILPLRKPRAALLSQDRFTMPCSFSLMLAGARSYRSIGKGFDRRCEPSPFEALTRNVESFLLTKISRKMRVYALPHPGRKQ